MRNRPNLSDVIMRPMFGQARGVPFDPTLTRETAPQIAILLNAHPMPEHSTPKVLARTIIKNTRGIGNP